MNDFSFTKWQFIAKKSFLKTWGGLDGYWVICWPPSIFKVPIKVIIEYSEIGKSLLRTVYLNWNR